MELTPYQCLALAQIYPIFLIAIAVEYRSLLRQVPYRRPERRLIAFSAFAAYLLGGLATAVAVTYGDDGTEGIRAAFLILSLIFFALWLALGAWAIETVHARQKEQNSERKKGGH